MSAYAFAYMSAACYKFQNPLDIHILLIMVLYSSPYPPSLPPGALKQRAEWSRAVLGDSDIHPMQWIINEHHLVHTTGEHSSNGWLQEASLSCSLAFPLTFFPHILPHSSRSLIISCFSSIYFSLSCLPSPRHHSPCASVASLTG